MILHDGAHSYNLLRLEHLISFGFVVWLTIHAERLRLEYIRRKSSAEPTIEYVKSRVDPRSLCGHRGGLSIFKV